MEYDIFSASVMKYADMAGFSDCEIYCVNRESFKTNVFGGEIDTYSVNTTFGIGFRGIYNGRMGYSFTEIMDEDSVKMLVDKAKQGAELSESGDVETIYVGSESYAQVETFSERLEGVTASSKLEKIKALERATVSLDPRITRTNGCVLNTTSSETRITNSKGLDLRTKNNYIFSYVEAIFEEDGKKSSGFAMSAKHEFDDLNIDGLAEEACKKAVEFATAAPIKTGIYDVIFDSEAMCDMLEAFSDIFSAYMAQKGMSLLKGRQGERIASEHVTLVDDAMMENGFGTYSFDDEGVAGAYKEIITNGVFNTFLYNLKTALKDGVKSTGNGAKSSYASPINVAPSNFYLKPGNSERREIFDALGSGPYITEVSGLHAGVDPISGEFSLTAKGYWCENGKTVRTINQITVAGNFFELLKNIEMVGNDLKFYVSFGSPTVLIKNISIAGI